MFGAIAGGIASALAGGAMSKLFGGGQKAASGGIQGDVLATDNNTVGMGDAGIKSEELLLLVYELNRSGLLAENEKIRPILAQLEKLLLCDLSPSTNDSVKN